jgi:hypothetical protein
MLPHKVVSSVLQADSSWLFLSELWVNFADIESTLVTNSRKEPSRLYRFKSSGLSDLEDSAGLNVPAGPEVPTWKS